MPRACPCQRVACASRSTSSRSPTPQSTQPPTEYIEVELQADGAASLGIHGQKFTKVKSRAQLAAELAALSSQHPALPLMISADKDIKYDEVVQTITVANKSGIARVGLATR